MKRLNRKITTCFFTSPRLITRSPTTIHSMSGFNNKWSNLKVLGDHGSRGFANWMNNFISSRKINGDQSNGDSSREKNKRLSALLLLLFGGVLVSVEAANYYTYSSQLENVKIIEEGNLTSGEMCKIYGQINSDVGLKLLDNQELFENNQEPVFIYEVSKEGKSFLFKSERTDRLRCHTNNLEVNFSYGKSFSDWLDSSNDSTKTLPVDLSSCKIFKEPREYSVSVEKYNAHTEYACNQNRNRENTRKKVYSLVDLFNVDIVQRVLNNKDQVILIGKVDPVSGVFKCETLMSPTDKAMYNKLNGELITSVSWAAFLSVIAGMVML